MNSIKLVIKTEQSFSMKYYFSCEELQRLKQLILNKGNAIIGECTFQSREGYLIHFKGRQFLGANYAMPLKGIVEMIDQKILDNC